MNPVWTMPYQGLSNSLWQLPHNNVAQPQSTAPFQGMWGQPQQPQFHPSQFPQPQPFQAQQQMNMPGAFGAAKRTV